MIAQLISMSGIEAVRKFFDAWRKATFVEHCYLSRQRQMDDKAISLFSRFVAVEGVSRRFRDPQSHEALGDEDYAPLAVR